MRLIDADDFDRWLANAEFTAALNNADDNDRPFEHEVMYYSTQSFRDVMSYRPTIDAIPVKWIETLLREWLKGSASFEACGAIAAMLYKWKKEQEANQ